MLRVDDVDLVGGRRTVHFSGGLSIIRGDITTGKTTLVRLLRALLGTVPDSLPPEVDAVSFLRGAITVAGGEWGVIRPVVTKRDAIVEVARMAPVSGELDESFRMPASGQGSFSRFLLDRLSLPTAPMPRARRDPSAGLTPVTMTDWLGYCIITGDELDSQVFGHGNQWRDQKRKWIFELVYGFYDSQTADLVAQLRSIELRLDAMDQQGEIIAKFLAETPFSDRSLLEQELVSQKAALEENASAQANLALESLVEADVSAVRRQVLGRTAQRDDMRAALASVEHQVQDLTDLHKQLRSQAARLTRAIVADEWLVDFDFVVCPRCGSDLDRHRGDHDTCYLCLQPQSFVGAPETLIAEQERLSNQIDETADLLTGRNFERAELLAAIADTENTLARLNEELNARTSSFVSAQTERIRQQSARESALRSNIDRLNEYLVLIDRFEASTRERTLLSDRAEELRGSIEARATSSAAAEEHVRALEKRLLQYLEALHIPQLGDLLTVQIKGPTWLPVVSGRTFDELSSQGLKTLVNAAHALAHHTVAIDRQLPLPGLLVLDGLSANAGREGFDGDRVVDLYRLLLSASAEYAGLLQIIAVDNDLPLVLEGELTELVALALSQQDRLIRSAQEELTAAGEARTTQPEASEQHDN